MTDATPPVTPAKMAGLSSWGYQLQKINLKRLAASAFDLLVIDYARDGSDDTALSRKDVAGLQQKPDGSRRIVLSYLSIGEAESYRYYWQRVWKKQPPAWLGPENPDWDENFGVHYWDPGWQAIIFGSPGAYLDKIIAAGFDGVYLDRVDAFDETDEGGSRADRLSAMTAFVRALADYARRQRPDFLIVPQNGEELLADPAYRAAIDGFAKEDLYFGIDGDGEANARGDVTASLELMAPLRPEGKTVLVVEYLEDASAITMVENGLEPLGYILYVGPRDLDSIAVR